MYLVYDAIAVAAVVSAMCTMVSDGDGEVTLVSDVPRLPALLTSDVVCPVRRVWMPSAWLIRPASFLLSSYLISARFVDSLGSGAVISRGSGTFTFCTSLWREGPPLAWERSSR